jgi:predicted transcriptional regulator
MPVSTEIQPFLMYYILVNNTNEEALFMSKTLLKDLSENYFKVENAIFERDDLNVYEKMVYILLCRFSNNNNGAFPSYDTISKKCSISRSKAIKVIKSLIEKNLVEKEERIRQGTNENTSNIYYIYSAELVNNVIDNNTPPSCPETPPHEPEVVADKHPKKNNSLKSFKKNYTTTKEPDTGDNVVVADNIFLLKNKIESAIGEVLGLKGLNKMLAAASPDLIQKYIDNVDKFDLESKETKMGFFIFAVTTNLPIPKSKNNKKASNENHANFQQREYSDEFYDGLYKTF